MAGKDANKDRAYWHQGLTLFVQLSGWLVGPLVVALFVGQWLDNRYHTSPWLFLGCVGVAFIVTSVGIVREALNAMKRIEQAAKRSDRLDDTEDTHK